MALKIFPALVLCVFFSYAKGNAMEQPEFSFMFGGQLHARMHSG